MKKSIILSLIIVILLSSCSRYTNLGEGGCGAWAPNKFETDSKAKRWVKSNAIRNSWK